jgi:hypothetical protein
MSRNRKKAKQSQAPQPSPGSKPRKQAGLQALYELACQLAQRGDFAEAASRCRRKYWPQINTDEHGSIQ